MKIKEESMKIAIIGGGYVGLYTALRINNENKGHKIDIIDIDQEKINRFNNKKSPIDDIFIEKFISKEKNKLKNIKYINTDKYEGYDEYFICLSTNPANGNEFRLNTKNIFNIAKKIREKNKKSTVIIRSTINIDDAFKLVELGLSYWPEFLSQGVEASKNIEQEINIYSKSNSEFVGDELFEKLFNDKNKKFVTVEEAIYIKLIHNTLDAHLINLTNLFANIAHENGINFDNIKLPVEKLLSNRPKLKRQGIGYGGSCYPKDSKSLIEITNNEQNKKLITALDEFNKKQMYSFLFNEELIRSANKIVVLGISFKGGTNDITKTPTVGIRKWLIDNKIDYVVWEPNISQNLLIEGEVISEDIDYDIKNSNLVIVASDWSEFEIKLKDYENDIIDLKNFIKDLPNRKLHKLGKNRTH